MKRRKDTNITKQGNITNPSFFIRKRRVKFILGRTTSKLNWIELN